MENGKRPRTQIVPIDKVLVDHEPQSWAVRQKAHWLKIQGQIEPLQVRPIGFSEFMTFQQDAWGAETVRAARLLEWPTLLVCITQRYIQ